jgi:hypothetical protein
MAVVKVVPTTINNLAFIVVSLDDLEKEWAVTKL